jgi:hypothetical protein
MALDQEAQQSAIEAAQCVLVWLYANEPAGVSKAAQCNSLPVQSLKGFTEVDPSVPTKFDPVLHRLGMLLSDGSVNTVALFGQAVCK